MLAPLQLLEYTIGEFAYRQDSDYGEDSPDEVEGVALSFSVEVQKASERVTLVRLTVHFNEENPEGEEAKRQEIFHRGHIEVVGQFAWATDEVEELSEGRRDRLMLNNSLSMLYGIARTYLAQISEPGPIPKLFLPSVSFRSHVEQWLEEERQKKS